MDVVLDVGQLILPEAVKKLPVNDVGLSKSAAFRSAANATSAPEEVAVDDRITALAYLVQSSVATTFRSSRIAPASCYPSEKIPSATDDLRRRSS